VSLSASSTDGRFDRRGMFALGWGSTRGGGSIDCSPSRGRSDASGGTRGGALGRGTGCSPSRGRSTPPESNALIRSRISFDMRRGRIRFVGALLSVGVSRDSAMSVGLNYNWDDML
jgi:hypothetical protein